jgi:hypothetical protein
MLKDTLKAFAPETIPGTLLSHYATSGPANATIAVQAQITDVH